MRTAIRHIVVTATINHGDEPAAEDIRSGGDTSAVKVNMDNLYIFLL